MSASASTLASLQSILQENFDISPERASAGTSLRELGIDSMMVLDVVMEVEDRLGIQLKDMAMPRDASLGDIVALIDRNIERGAAP